MTSITLGILFLCLAPLLTVYLFEISYYIAQGGLELAMKIGLALNSEICLPPKCWDLKRTLPYSVINVFFGNGVSR